LSNHRQRQYLIFDGLETKGEYLVADGRSMQKNFNAIDLTKFVASIFVVYIHTEPLKSIAPEANFIILNILARWAIPFFFMTSGYLYYSKFLSSQSRSKFLSDYGLKYLKRVLILYFVWSLVYLPYMIYQTLSLPNPNVKLIFYGLRNVLYSGTSYHMWYFTALIFSIIILDVWISRFKLKSLLVLSAVFYLVGLLGESYIGLIHPESILSSAFKLYFKFFLTTRNGVFFGLFFIVLGAYYYERPLKLAVYRSVLFSIVSICFLCVEVLLLAKFTQPKDYNFMILSVPLSLYLFHALININLSWNLSYKSLRKLSTVIYCSHVAFIVIYSTFLRYLRIEALVESGLLLFSLVLFSSIFFSMLVIKLENYKLIGFIAKKLV